MFILTLIITDCGFVFGIHIIFYVYNLPMGYAFYCFIFSIIFSIIDWGFSLKRFVSKYKKKTRFHRIIILFFNMFR
jgi:hypothetical protein